MQNEAPRLLARQQRRTRTPFCMQPFSERIMLRRTPTGAAIRSLAMHRWEIWHMQTAAPVLSALVERVAEAVALTLCAQRNLPPALVRIARG
jgi:hypothetical protein